LIDPIVLHRKDTLSFSEVNYWKDLLYRVLKVGTEIEVAVPKGETREKFEEDVRSSLEPSGTYEALGHFGVVDVSPEHCGVEIRVIGRQPYFRAIQEQYLEITTRLLTMGARARSTCGLHFHLLAPGLAEPVPEIILANLWNLVRRYSPELRFITSGGDKRIALCRRRNHTSHQEMVRHSPIHMTMAEIQNELRNSKLVPEHQNFFNLQHLQFDEDGGALPFHLEFRFPDADLSATSITAKVFLFLALILKAVELSQYGVIHVGKVNPWRRKNELLNMLSNNDGNLATSDTSQITESVLGELRSGCHELLDLLAPTFEQFGENPSLDLLELLAETPISILRCAGYNWTDIEEILAKRSHLDDIGIDDVDQKLMKSIELHEWENLGSLEEWKWRAALEVYLTPQELERRLEKINTLKGIHWSVRHGTLVFGH
jgi:hypothetical protein